MAVLALVAVRVVSQAQPDSTTPFKTSHLKQSLFLKLQRAVLLTRDAIELVLPQSQKLDVFSVTRAFLKCDSTEWMDDQLISN